MASVQQQLAKLGLGGNVAAQNAARNAAVTAQPRGYVYDTTHMHGGIGAQAWNVNAQEFAFLQSGGYLVMSASLTDYTPASTYFHSLPAGQKNPTIDSFNAALAAKMNAGNAGIFGSGFDNLLTQAVPVIVGVASIYVAAVAASAAFAATATPSIPATTAVAAPISASIPAASGTSLAATGGGSAAALGGTTLAASSIPLASTIIQNAAGVVPVLDTFAQGAANLAALQQTVSAIQGNTKAPAPVAITPAQTTTNPLEIVAILGILSTVLFM